MAKREFAGLPAAVDLPERARLEIEFEQPYLLGPLFGDYDRHLLAIEDRLHVHDLHATILHLMGIDHTRLVYMHKGRPERATLNEGEVFEKIATG